LLGAGAQPAKTPRPVMTNNARAAEKCLFIAEILLFPEQTIGPKPCNPSKSKSGLSQ
jgi:hypothetical protein